MAKPTGGHVHPSGQEQGITLRQHFACEIMKAIITGSPNGLPADYAARAAATYADVLIDELMNKNV